ncbi:hypothetical protein ABPG77_004526 [Micractinium sp. CCAP 211/92]
MEAKPWELTLAVLRGNLLWANSLLRHPSANSMRHERCSLPLLHAIAAADAAALVPAAVAAGLPITSASVTVWLSKRRLGPAIDLIPQEAAAVLLDRHGICALTLAASLGHAATVAALLAAGADPNPVHPDGQPVLHPLAAAATVQDEAAALATCQVLLAAGADVAGALPHLPAGGRHSRSCSWLLNMQSSRVEQLILGALLERWKNDSWRPSTWGTASALVLLAAQADHRQAFQKFASHLPAGRLPAEYAELAEDAVGAALRAACWGSRGDVLRCLVQLATGDRPQRSSRPSQPHVLSLHLSAELAASLEAAAADGDLQVLQCLVRAGTVVSQTAVKAAVCSGRPAALALLLQHGAPSAPPLLAGTVPTVSATAFEEEDGLPADDSSWPGAYPCPLLTLLAHHAHEGLDPLHPDSLEMAEMLVAAGCRPASCRSVPVQVGGHPQAQLAAFFHPGAEDASLTASGSDRFLWLAITQPDWSRTIRGRFPPAMQRATRTLLLVAARGAAAGSAPAVLGASAGAQGLAGLPGHVLDHVLHLAAYPLSAWARAPWEAAAAWLAA